MCCSSTEFIEVGECLLLPQGELAVGFEEATADVCVLLRDILVRILVHEERSDKSDQRANAYLDGDRGGGFINGEQPGGDQGGRPTGDNRRELITN